MNPRNLSAPLAVAYVFHITNGDLHLSINRLRVWAHRHPGISAGRAPDNTALYNVDAILRHAEQRSLHKRTNNV